jgi:hypothetical protein
MTEDTWTTRDLPVLRAVVDINEQDGEYLTDANDIERATGFDGETVQRALRALSSYPSHFEKVLETSAGIDSVGPPTAEARRAAGAWPSPENLLERLIAALQYAAKDETREPEERSKLKQAASVLGSLATQLAINALGGAAGNVLSS